MALKFLGLPGDEILNFSQRERQRKVDWLAEDEAQGEQAEMAREAARRAALNQDSLMRQRAMTEQYQQNALDLQRRGQEFAQQRAETDDQRMLQESLDRMQAQPYQEGQPLSPGSRVVDGPGGQKMVILPEQDRGRVYSLDNFPEIKAKFPSAPKMMTKEELNYYRMRLHDQDILRQQQAGQAAIESRAQARENAALGREQRRLDREHSADLEALSAAYDNKILELRKIYQPEQPRYTGANLELAGMDQAQRTEAYFAAKQALEDERTSAKRRRSAAFGYNNPYPYLDARTGQPKQQAPQAPQAPEAPAISGAPPASALKEGVETTFANGQVWTLRNGKPERIK